MIRLWAAIAVNFTPSREDNIFLGHFFKLGRSAFKILPGKRSLGWLRRIWEDTIKMDVKEICISTRSWVASA